MIRPPVPPDLAGVPEAALLVREKERLGASN
jgi:hypothetical protein